MHELCQELGLPMAEEKDEGPTTLLQFLGLVVDTKAMEIRLRISFKASSATGHIRNVERKKSL